MEHIVGSDIYLENTAIALGKFEGLHLGHKLLISELEKYYALGLKSVLFTFDVSPEEFFSGKRKKVLYTKEERLIRINKYKIDYFYECNFENIYKLSPEEFVEEILVKKLGVKVIIVGENYCFGYNRKGNIDTLRKLSYIYNYDLCIVKQYMINENRISSSEIKKELKKGNLENVNLYLGEKFSIISEVIHGRELGRRLGMPTANQEPEENKLLPQNGVYIVKVTIDDCKYYGISNIGVKPTIDDNLKRGVETFIFNFNQNIYGKIIKIEFLKFIRPERKFTSIEELKNEMERNVEFAKEWVKINS